MANIGTTSILVEGAPEHLHGFRDRMLACSTDGSSFSLKKLLATDRVGSIVCDPAWADFGDRIELRVDMWYDRDCLGIQLGLSALHPELRFRGLFDCDGSRPDFTLSRHSRGQQDFLVEFEIFYRAFVGAGGGDSGDFQTIGFFARTAAHDAAKADLGTSGMEAFAGLLPVAGQWRRSLLREGASFFLRPESDGSHTVVAVVAEDSADLLLDVDRNGGYGGVRRLEADELPAAFPELAQEVTKVWRELARQRRSWTETVPEAFDWELAF